MTKRHERRRRSARVGEPVQVYLQRPDRERLERLSARLDATKSEVLRRGLEALETVTRPSARPASPPPPPLPTYRGEGLQPGVDLDDTASLLDLMDRGSAFR
jgi:hypothetical protein